jgi:threonine synthase
MVADGGPIVAGFRCAVCGAQRDIAEPMSWCCSNSSSDDRHHSLAIVSGKASLRSSGDANPFLAYRRHLAWDAFAAAHGLTAAARDALIGELDSRVAAVAGVGFASTPFRRADRLSAALGFDADGGVWVKDETGGVAGSHKARHLFTILLHLVTVERLGLAAWKSTAGRPSLAIASCGNAALAAATLAAAAEWPLRVFVPPAASRAVLQQLATLRADVVVCPRESGDPPGDPCVHRFREAVAEGAVPFSVQGPENAWCLDGGRTIGWEMATVCEDASPERPLDRVFVQVGGGALASCLAGGLAASGLRPKLHAVQTAGCAPLARAWGRSGAQGGASEAASRWAELMWPWDHPEASAADGILDDETYDWLGVFDSMATTGGSPVVVPEASIIAAHEEALRCTGIDASPTGTAGLAGLLTIRADVSDHERVAVVFSGVRR